MVYTVGDPLHSGPDTILYIPSPVRGLPATGHAWGQRGVVGTGSGAGCQAICSAIGEYLERCYAYGAVSADGQRQQLADMGETSYTDALAAALGQLCSEAAQDDLGSHRFLANDAVDLIMGKPIRIPTALVSLSRAWIKDDARFIPYTDTCGQAVGPRLEKALSAALYEFLERQALVAAWQLGKSLRRIDGLSTLTCSTSLAGICRVLESAGDLMLVDLALGELPAHIVFAAFRGRDTTDRVGYSCGLGASSNPSTAIERAVKELYLGYELLNNPMNTADVYNTDAHVYLSHFINCNSIETIEFIPFLQNHTQPPISADQYGKLPDTSFSDVIVSFERLGANLPVFIRRHDKCNVWFVSISSPDFYLHMNVAKPLNFANKYAEHLGINTTMPNRREIPFP